MKTEKEIMLRNYFQQQGMTFKSAAEKLGVHPSQVGNLVSGRNKFGTKVAKTWEEHFGISAEWLMYGRGEMMRKKKDVIITSIEHAGGTAVIGSNNIFNGEKSSAEDIIRSQQETIREQQRHIDRIMALLEKAYE